MWLVYNQQDPLQGPLFNRKAACSALALSSNAPTVISFPHKPQTEHRLLIEWHAAAAGRIIRQSLITVLQSPTVTTASHYLQIHLGSHSWPNLDWTGALLHSLQFYFSLSKRIQLNIGKPWCARMRYANWPECFGLHDFSCGLQLKNVSGY